MKKLFAILVGAALALVAPALAQAPNITGNTFQTQQAGKTVQGLVGMCVDVDNIAKPCASGSGGSNVNISGVNGAPPSSSNPIWVAPAGSAPFPVLSSPRSSINTAGCTVGTSSAQCLAASTANFWIQVQNTHATNSVACSWGGTAALNANNSFMLAPGQSASWGLISSGVPTQAINCIATAGGTPLYLEWR